MSGVAFEFSYLAWLWASSRRSALLSAGLSMLTGAISVYGISSVVTGPELLPWLLAGYGVGSYAACMISKHI